MNKFIAVGRLVREIKIETSSNNEQYIQNCIASEIYNFKKQKKETLFINFITTNEKMEYLNKYAKKGDMIYVECYLTPKNFWDDIKRINYPSVNFNIEKIKLFTSNIN